MRYYDELATFEREGFTVVVDKTWDETNPRDCFETEDADEICRKIDDGALDWFMLRVRVFVEGNELGSAYLGACCYEDASEVLKDGVAEDMIYEAMAEAKAAVYPLMRKLQAINEVIEREGVTCD